jgi:hypothetical protein
MGMPTCGFSKSSFSKSRSLFDKKRETNFVESSLPNPKPNNYSVVKWTSVLKESPDRVYLIIFIKYHDCTNYEGKKIMVYECSYSDLMKQILIDPHFCDNKDYYSPIARFEPTDKGWDNAVKFVNVL